MLFELYDLPINTQTAHVVLGLLAGLIFGIAAQVTRFCLRRSVVGDASDRAEAGAVWLTAFATAIASFAALQATGLIDMSGHRFAATELPLAAIIVGGLTFGAGMVLTRGCVSRLTVLGASGNLRAITVIAIFAVVAHATAKGVLAPLRTSLADWTVAIDLDLARFAPVFALAIAAAALHLARRSQVRPGHLALGALIGVVPVLGWSGTSVLLMDEFDPLPVQSAAFTAPWSDGLFWIIASTAVPAGFGVGWIAGVLAGAFSSSVFRGEFQLQSFESPAQTGRYAAGAALMGTGGVLAGGCTVGAGLSGGAMLSVAALTALAAIVIGAVVMNRVLQSNPAAVVPAE
ncbi:YeeE/YedE family protein [Shimia ponticola]|uniref:YeeE/YedE family protein n=1 Tax=Shimia ponticola TaxID=2582893 RepID=UPI0011BD5ACA|nr:YeeE/YedE family protein [Shimia ponticola]